MSNQLEAGPAGDLRVANALGIPAKIKAGAGGWRRCYAEAGRTGWRPFAPTTDPAAAREVRRKMEVDGWGWSLDYFPEDDEEVAYRARFRHPESGRLFSEYAETEELATCRAAESAMEGE